MGIHSLAAYLAQSPGAARTICIDLSLVRARLTRARRHAGLDAATADPVKYLMRMLERVRPSMLGISAKWGSSNQLAELFRGLANSSLASSPPQIVVGNSVAIMNPDQVLDIAAACLPLSFPPVLACTGEGEETFLQLVQQLPRLWPTWVFEIPNLAFRSAGSNDVIRTTRANVHTPDLPPLLAAAKRDMRGIMRIAEGGSEAYLYVAEAVRGCGFGHSEETACRYCAITRYQPGSVRGLELPTILGNLRLVQEVRQEFGKEYPVYFPDWDFMDYGLQRVGRLADAMVSENLRVPFVFATRADRIARRRGMASVVDTFERLRRAGLIGIFVGIDSGAQSVLNRIGKGLTVDVNESAIRLLRGENVDGVQLPGGPLGAAFGYITFADPFISPGEVAEQLSFIERMDLLAHEVNAYKTVRLQVGMGGMAIDAARAGLILGHKSTLEFDYIFDYAAVQAIVDTCRAVLRPLAPFRYLLRDLDGNVTFYHIDRFPAAHQALARWVYEFRQFEFTFITGLLGSLDPAAAELRGPSAPGRAEAINHLRNRFTPFIVNFQAAVRDALAALRGHVDAHVVSPTPALDEALRRAGEGLWGSPHDNTKRPTIAAWT